MESNIFGLIMIIERLASRILVMDGAMGTLLQRQAMPLGWCCDMLNLTKSTEISRIHREYLDAGADIITTNTFNANAISLSKYQLADKVKEINRAGVKIAHEAIDEFCTEKGMPSSKRPLIAGCIGPTELSLTRIGDEAGFQTLADAIEKQAIALIDAGADILLLETIYDIQNARAAAIGITRAMHNTGCDIPLMLSATLNEEGRLSCGGTLAEFVRSMEQFNPMSFGINCGNGVCGLSSHIDELGSLTERFISVHPNAGIPDEAGHYPITPTRFANELHNIIDTLKANIIGGCCGTTPAHIRIISEAIRVANQNK
ncbi:MAG: homocysteine S-methyltransferase family protein [Muribaculaceae bacterium]|nr:homocysteine S-methyltransferase family protein [Muribaculaceae bacterium]